MSYNLLYYQMLIRAYNFKQLTFILKYLFNISIKIFIKIFTREIVI